MSPRMIATARDFLFLRIWSGFNNLFNNFSKHLIFLSFDTFYFCSFFTDSRVPAQNKNKNDSSDKRDQASRFQSRIHPSRSFVSSPKSFINFHSCGFFGGVNRIAFAIFSAVSGIGSGIVYLTGRPRLRFGSG